MIQRIQTLFLLGVVLLSGLILAFPVCQLATGVVLKDNFISSFSNIGLATLNFIIPAIALATILLYKNRKLQIKLTVVTIIALVIYYLLLLGYVLQLPNNAYSLGFTVAIPAINILLGVLAIRAIRKDENLVKSLDRLR